MPSGMPGLAILIAKHKKQMDSPAEEEDQSSSETEGGDQEKKKTAMSEFLDAVKADDVEAALEAFEALCTLCDEDY